MIILLYSMISILCIMLEVVNNLILIKKLADRGYRYDKFRIFNFKIFLLIPIFNIIAVITRIILFNVNLKRFVSKNIIPMTKAEKELYKKNISIKMAIKLNRQVNLFPNMVLVYTENDHENIIYFIDDEDRYIITSVKGPISKFSRRSQYHTLKKQLNDIDAIANSKKEIQKEELLTFSKNSMFYGYNI